MLSSFFTELSLEVTSGLLVEKKQTLLRTLDRPRKYENELLPRKKLHVSLVHTASNFQIWLHINTKQQKRHNNRSTANWYVDMKKRTITSIFSLRFCFHSVLQFQLAFNFHLLLQLLQFSIVVASSAMMQFLVQL